ncbi:hypothetical protein [Streptomyces scopuliridis]|uniref:Uncharacterized protein n=1 Tax=Streptomyces scopuliridis RB72 TaxID=1440053 RepID=A0A2T7SP54_9ACTN|nr:hypothetical protein [Streptomyces scopuliridis]PVE04680.1 hypothetical protein Y717_10820 [Streptomyces scopuliridis RB72]
MNLGNITTYNVVSLGGVTVGLSLLAWEITRWWPGRKNLLKLKKLLDLLPFTLAALYGMLLILSAGGILGGGANVALWGGSEIGDATLQYGLGAGTPDATRTSNLVLTDGGHAFVIVCTVILFAIWTKRGGFRWDLARAVFCGITLGLSAGVAGIAGYVLSPVVSAAGDSIVGLL